jgi:hypothetical protein
MWVGRWAAAAAAAKAARVQRQREDAALAAADASMGRGRQSKRRLGALSAAAAAEMELLQLLPGERQVRGGGAALHQQQLGGGLGLLAWRTSSRRSRILLVCMADACAMDAMQHPAEEPCTIPATASSARLSVLLVVTYGPLLLLLLQEKRSRNDTSNYEAALADLSPAPVAQLLAAALASSPADAQPACHAPPGAIMLPGLARSSSSSLARPGASADGGVAAGVTACPVAGLVLRLALISGWHEDAPGLVPPLYQRRLAAWLRHKLAPHLPPGLGLAAAAAVAAAGASRLHRGRGQPELVALGGEQQSQQQQQPEQEQQQPQRLTWAAIAAAPPVGRHRQQTQQQVVPQAAAGGGMGASAGRQVWRLGPEAELLLSKAVPLPGREQQPLLVEVLDLVSSRMQAAAAAAAHGSSSGPASCLAGAAGLLLLVSGPDEAELQSAVARLAAVLAHAAPAPAVPLVVLAASGAHRQRQCMLCS